MSFGGNGGGTSSISGSNDVLLSSPAAGQVLTYDSTSAKWKNIGPAVVVLAAADPDPDPTKLAEGTLVVRLP